MNKEFLDALNELEREKNISKEDIIAAIEKAVKTTYERNYSKDQKVDVVVDRTFSSTPPTVSRCGSDRYYPDWKAE